MDRRLGWHTTLPENREGVSPTSLYEASKTLIPKPEKDGVKTKKYNLTQT